MLDEARTAKEGMTSCDLSYVTSKSEIVEECKMN